MKLTLTVVSAAAVIALAGCSSPALSSSSAPPVSTAAKAAPSPACTLKTTFDYIVRDSLPGASVQASEIGNVDLSACADSLTTFRATAGQAPGECSTIALASKNPGYNVDAVPAPPLKHVIESAGPGC